VHHWIFRPSFHYVAGSESSHNPYDLWPSFLGGSYCRCIAWHLVGDGQMTDGFKAWMKQCDNQVSAKIGSGAFDLPDATWRDYFDDGMTPAEAIDFAYMDQWSDVIPDYVWYS
tara:strand:+ start:908 stop:1246 length:339 start_codon:yes stop_codon:yes gene_type:complete